LKVVEKSLPLGGRDHKRLVRLPHRATGVLLRSTGRPADHLRDKVLEPRRRHPITVDEVIDHRRDSVYSAEPLVETGLITRSHRIPPLCEGSPRLKLS